MLCCNCPARGPKDFSVFWNSPDCPTSVVPVAIFTKNSPINIYSIFNSYLRICTVRPTANIKFNYKHDAVGIGKMFVKKSDQTARCLTPNNTAIYTFFDILPLNNLASNKHILPEGEFSQTQSVPTTVTCTSEFHYLL